MSLSGSEIQIIKNELESDPLTKGYSGMSEQAVVDSLNAINRSIDRYTISSSDAQTAVVQTEYNSLTQVKRDSWQAILSDSIKINDANIQIQISDIWVAGTITRTNLDSFKTKQVSRATELGIGKVKIGDIQQGRM